MCARFGRSPPLCSWISDELKFAAIRSISNNLVFLRLFNVFDFFSFQIVNREKRRFLERTGRFYAFTFGISQKSAVLIY